ncbi:unnamed protein product [Enterobius vermicularis]|uniref:Sorting nexin-14 n=1 Tax=Enterobius vermicularis TaxID=51028 RepID=A0A158Q9Q9_ENTVE|nr:unnamed protein product [Enterobius vermicularis]
MDFLRMDWSYIGGWKVLLGACTVITLLSQFSLLPLFLILIAVITGYLCARTLLMDGGKKFSLFLKVCVGKQQLLKNSDNDSDRGHFKQTSANSLPWDELSISEPVNGALEELIEQILDNYVNSWYKTEINGDPAFVAEIRYHIRYFASLLFRKMMELDLASLLLTEAVPVTVIHCQKILRLEEQVDKKMLTSRMIETKILEELDDLHYSLTSRENEVNYLRQLADLLIASYVDESRVAGFSKNSDVPRLHSSLHQWPSHVCNHFLREIIVFAFFLPLLDLIADPDTINHLILLFGPETLPAEQHGQAKRVEFLCGLTKSEFSDASSSLLQLKLSEVLRDYRNLQLFTTYLNDVKGPVNELKFLLYSGDVHERMLSLQKEDENALSEIHYDTWEIFREYVHEESQDRVSLPEEIFNDFRTAVERRDTELLDQTLEKAFQLVYRHLQRDYLLPFCQSECYFRHLCGSPPVSTGDLIATECYSANNVQTAISESTFSFSQFRRRLWKVIMPLSADGSIDGLNNYDGMSSVSLSNSVAEEDLQEEINDTAGDANEISKEAHHLLTEQELMSGKHMLTTSCGLPLFDPDRDMNRWIVTIPHVDSRKNMYMYIVCVERFDLTDNSLNTGVSRNDSCLNKWSVIRRYNEFFVLESKLMEFHGVLLKTEPLPPRKPFSKKTKEFIEAHRLPFQRFLQLLTQQTLLKKSDLLFAFLTSDQEFKDNIQLSGLNPWNVVRKMPSKFSRERGQNLRPFLLSLLANTLASNSKPVGLISEQVHERNFSGSSLVSSQLSEEMSRSWLLLTNSLYSGNVLDLKNIRISPTEYRFWTRSFTDCLLFLMNCTYSVGRWVFTLLISMRYVVFSNLDFYVYRLFRQALSIAFLDANCVRMIRLIQESLFGCASTPTSDQEKVLRSELALRRILEYCEEELPSCILKLIGVKKFRHSTSTLFHVLQYPRLNKQLSYVLLDILVQKVLTVPEQEL